MKKTIITLMLSVVAVIAMADDIMTKQGDTYVINTTTLCNTKGYKGTTPLEVYIAKGKIVKIVALKNMETKGYFARVKKSVIAKYESLKVSKAKKLSRNPDIYGFTGATFSTRAVQANINAALNYYESHK